ncbi:hypothetical protein roselon_00397 [Roseibacterium elongatum DSM 19469]|uniref:Uncharacterized protein n=1 Tax=Roseicyclus elongatus DSM 19469 TaxID=1294273 RepID=W8RYC0_9RHOB|nr:hypothetical protein [Roseibacterium elongatum]AHM02842.1 hypothetical protein roselon_00397 [Roseibacterium elongatum DSM 19469]
MILHAPLALIAGLFAVTVLWITPQGGLQTAPTGIVAQAAQGPSLWSDGTERFALFD